MTSPGCALWLATRHVAPVAPASLTVVDLADDVARLRAIGLTPHP